MSEVCSHASPKLGALSNGQVLTGTSRQRLVHRKHSGLAQLRGAGPDSRPVSAAPNSQPSLTVLENLRVGIGGLARGWGV